MLFSVMLQSRQIEAFRAVMRTGAMTTAADMIHVTQPAVSRLIRDLELELGFALFHRRGNLVAPTAQAHALLTEVDRSFIGLGRIRDFADDLRRGQGGTLRVATLPAMAAGFVPRFAAGFSRDRPRLRMSIDGLPSPVIRDRVVAGQFDIGMVAVPFQQHGLTVTALDDQAVLALPVGHRLAQKRVVVAEDLHDENLILLSKFAYGLHPVVLALQSVRRGRVIETPLSTIACAFVSEGLGVAIVDPFSGSDFIGRGVVLRAFEPSLTVGTAVVHSSDRALSIIATEFRVAFLDHATRFLERAAYLDF